MGQIRTVQLEHACFRHVYAYSLLGLSSNAPKWLTWGLDGWLQGKPVYAPASVTFVLTASTHQVASACMGPFEVQPHDAEQIFAFEPALCLGGELLVCNAVYYQLLQIEALLHLHCGICMVYVH